jgi:hypothetical protein
MKVIMKYRNLTYTLCTFLLIYTSMKAQVTIGADREPHSGAILELVSNNTHGLLLPRLSLGNASTWGLGGNPVEGMTVYNESSSTANNLKGKGIYVWTGGVWRITGQLPCTAAPTVGAISLSNDKPSKNVMFQAWVAPVDGAIQYIWETLGAGMAGYSNTNIISLAGSATGNCVIRVKAVNACGVGNQVERTVAIN